MDKMIETRTRSKNSAQLVTRLLIIACSLASLCEVAISAGPADSRATMAKTMGESKAKRPPLRAMRVCVGDHHPDCYSLEPTTEKPASAVWQLRRENPSFVTTTELETPAEANLAGEAFAGLEGRLRAEIAAESKASLAELVKRQKEVGACLESVHLEAPGQKLLAVCKKRVTEGQNGLREFAEKLARLQRGQLHQQREQAH